MVDGRSRECAGEKNEQRRTDSDSDSDGELSVVN